MDIELHNDHNVYILGAGFSADAGAPVVSAFMSRMRDAHEWLAAQERTPEANAIAKVLEFRRSSASAAHRVQVDIENIEELFSLASALAGRASSPRENEVCTAISATLDYALSVAKPRDCELRFEKESGWAVDSWALSPDSDPSSLQYSWYSVPIYDFYLGLLSGYFSDNPNGAATRNTFVTFNYDTLVEDALDHLSVPYSYGFRPKSVTFDNDVTVARSASADHAIKLLKLHGSVNWAIRGGKGGKLRVYKDYAAVRENGKTPLLVPPTWRKIFAKQLADIWTESVQAIANATRIVVLGFSIPPTDIHFKYLLAAGLRENVSLRSIHFVDPRGSRGVSERVGKVLDGRHLEGILSVHDETIGSFLLSVCHDGSIGRQVNGPCYREDELPTWVREGRDALVGKK